MIVQKQIVYCVGFFKDGATKYVWHDQFGKYHSSPEPSMAAYWDGTSGCEREIEKVQNLFQYPLKIFTVTLYVAEYKSD